MSGFQGEFVWYDLMTSDVSGARAFYSEVIGWGTRQWEDGDADYTMWTVDDQTLGGLMALPAEAKSVGVPPHWLGYVATAEINATVAKITTLGGQIHVPPKEIPKVGMFAVFADPQGATLALFQPGDKGDPPNVSAKGVGRFSWHELMTSDLDGAFRFYESAFGWKKTEALDMGEVGLYQMYGTDTRTLGGMMKSPADTKAPPSWLYYTTVRDLDGAVTQVIARGGSVVAGPMDVPGGERIVQCLDPQGATFALHSSKQN
jgi:predicted enzyme related to lactoylglutathione lyase